MKLSENNQTDAALKIAAAVALLYYGNKAYASAQKKSAEADVDTNPSAGQAGALKDALRPYWVKYLWGINVDAIMRVAKEITNLDDVNEHYKKIVDDDKSLYDDLQTWLTPDQYQEFLSYATKGKTGSYFYAEKSDKVPANYWVITKLDTNVRRTPKYYWQYDFTGNLVKTVPKGMILGASTGKYAYDKANKILFIEFWTLTQKGQKKTYYAAKSQIEFVSKEEKIKREKQGKIPLQILEGLDAAESENISGQEVITKEATTIYDEKFNQVGVAAKNIIIGFPIMVLDTGKTKHIKLKTVQGLIRWVRENQVEIRDRRV
jgi:hypothetical protein